jgi:hypothetical protein
LERGEGTTRESQRTRIGTSLAKQSRAKTKANCRFRNMTNWICDPSKC